MALHDPLTDLPNRVLFRQRLESALHRVSRGESCAVLCLDLDQFKGVNDTLGHPVGDTLLKAVTERLRRIVRPADTVARLGGDEFAVLLTGATPEAAARVSESIERAVEAIWPIGIRGGVSIGVASVGQGATEALSRADRSMYAKKRAA